MGGVVRRYIDFLILPIPTPLVLALFCSSIPTSLFIFSMFFFFVYIIFVQYSKRCSKNIRDHSKIEIMPTWRYNYIDKHVDYESQDLIPRARYRVTFYRSYVLTLCTIMAS